jgi:hypothetical protein
MPCKAAPYWDDFFSQSKPVLLASTARAELITALIFAVQLRQNREPCVTAALAH